MTACIYLVLGEMGRAGSVLSAHFSKTINSVHKTQWSKTLKGKKYIFFAASEIMLWQTARFKVFKTKPLFPFFYSQDGKMNLQLRFMLALQSKQ